MKELLKYLESLFTPQFELAGFGKMDSFEEDDAKLANVMFKKGGGGTQVVEKPVYTPPPAAPAMTEAATQEDAVTPEEEEKRKKEALRTGTKSLQIPVSGSAGGTSQVGTGAGERTGGTNRG